MHGKRGLREDDHVTKLPSKEGALQEVRRPLGVRLAILSQAEEVPDHLLKPRCSMVELDDD
ncbi:MAG TPA: hypothetical protein VFY87_30765, partial [Geminicoccaceae bacterium]|nr:hypothetical protein [Geminicoccaceae bacterium]